MAGICCVFHQLATCGVEILLGVFGADEGDVKMMPVKEGDSVTLQPDVPEEQKKMELEWSFATAFIAGININSQQITYNDSADKRFTDRLKLDNQTGSLTITNTTNTDSGVYHLQTTGTKLWRKSFRVTVYAPLPIPDITRYCPSSSSSSSSCSLVCTVMHVSRVTLSWYKGNSLLSSISVSDLSISLSLHLEVEYQDNNTYSCVLNNPISNQTRHPNITQLCHTGSGSAGSGSAGSENLCYCGSAESVIRLVVSALMGVAAVAAVVVLIYDIRSRKVEQARREQTK